jgi:hypothetical protein
VIDQDWGKNRPEEVGQLIPPGGSAVDSAVDKLRTLLHQWAKEFAKRRSDVGTAGLSFGSRGLGEDEAAAFLRAIEANIVTVDAAGYVRCAGTRQKSPEGVYSLFGKNGDGVCLNTEYLIQFGAAAELVVNYRWPSDDVLVEVGEFDAVVERGLQTIVAVEAKARVDGSDGLARLLESFVRFSSLREPPAPNDNHSRKYVDLLRRCAGGPAALWLVANGARWAFQAERIGNALSFTEMPNSSLANAAETSPSVEDAYALARATEIDGEQRAYPYQWSSDEELTEFVETLKSRFSEGDLSHTRPWRWFAKTSGGDPLTAAGERCGLELRFSWYQ